jgi:hypothetical protein
LSFHLHANRWKSGALQQNCNGLIIFWHKNLADECQLIEKSVKRKAV